MPDTQSPSSLDTVEAATPTFNMQTYLSDYLARCAVLYPNSQGYRQELTPELDAKVARYSDLSDHAVTCG